MKLIYIFTIWRLLVVDEEVESASFPDNFLFGFATSSYQIEGAWNEDGKGENVWDRFVHTQEDRILDRSTGDTACDSYHRYKEDVQMLKNMKADVYRFSLSWSRILPRGDLSLVNRAGIDYYKELIDELIDNNVKPMVTLFHWDLPQPLQDLGGWPNPIMIEYFKDFAKLAFDEFGDKVEWWITFNEPFETCVGAYGRDMMAPAINISGVADYLCTHNVLKSHARVYHLYNQVYRKRQKGKLGISLNRGWREPLTDSEEDKKAAQTSLEFEIGWFLHPILGSRGDYPQIMKTKVNRNSEAENLPRSRLPTFSNTWRRYIQNTIDFLGINHYTTFLVTPANDIHRVPSFQNDLGVSLSQNPNWPGSPTAPWLKVDPDGFRKKLVWLKNYTNNFPIIITENGYADAGEMYDIQRISYHEKHLYEIWKAIKEDGCNIIGYVAWSLMDNFEWTLGYTAKFGVYKVNFSDPNRSRRPKASAQFFKTLIENRSLKPFQLF